jgi:hypothetical protein
VAGAATAMTTPSPRASSTRSSARGFAWDLDRGRDVAMTRNPRPTAFKMRSMVVFGRRLLHIRLALVCGECQPGLHRVSDTATRAEGGHHEISAPA